MTRICLLIALAFTTAIHAQIVNPANGHTYTLTPTTMTYAAARAYANSVGGNLAAINDAAENAFVTSNFAVSGGQPWIGLTDEAQEGVFHWDSGEALTYTNWAGGQPDNYLGNENYVELAVNGVWNDLSAAYVKLGVVEIPGSGPNAALSFDGVDDRVTIPSNNILDGAGDFTIETWVKITSLPHQFSTMIVKHASGSAIRPFLLSAYLGVVHLSLNYDPATNTADLHINGTTNIVGAWHHIAFRRLNGQVEVFIDGLHEMLDGNNTSVAVSAPVAATSAPIMFGHEPYGQKLAGLIDEVRIWSVARSQTEIQADMNHCLTGNEPGLVGYWPLNNGGATGAQSVADHSPTGANGFRGSNTSTDSDDPSWVSTDVAPILPNATAHVLLVPSQFPTIQSAINASCNGDIVRVAPGTYFEHLDFAGKAIVVTSVAGAAVTVIDGGGTGRCVYFGNGESQSSKLEGFTITHGRAIFNGFGYSDDGGGVMCWFASPVIANCVVTLNVSVRSPHVAAARRRVNLAQDFLGTALGASARRDDVRRG